MDKLVKKAAGAAGNALLRSLRYAVYVLLLVVGRVLKPVADLAVGVGLIVFLFCLVLRRDMVTPMWAGAGVAVAGVLVSVLYDDLLRLVAPADVVIVSEG